MIFAVSVQQDLEKAICPETITKGRMLPRAMLHEVKDCCHIINPTIITKSTTPPPVMLVLVISLGYTLYQLNPYKGGS